MTAYNIAPFSILAEAKTGGVDYTSPEIEIPYNADRFSVHMLSTQDGDLLIQEDYNGTYTTIDTVPVTANVPEIVEYTAGTPKMKFVLQTTVNGTFTAHVKTVLNSEY